MAGENQPLRILVVCTANQCRSPLTAAMIARRAAESGVELVVTSAGTQAVDGMPATPPTIDAARKLG
ncbi:MAG TPA: low molecular weight phosphotyrosine protein phosphatase, partial [Acidimicrobiia bacterium]|nr:low molecular weight phosphotyrosine protein phosphatase [Acidimicrobiia bacterium]